jgi:hypothetical protein
MVSAVHGVSAATLGEKDVTHPVQIGTLRVKRWLKRARVRVPEPRGNGAGLPKYAGIRPPCLRWQACCFDHGMSDHAYDISYLLDSEAATVEAPQLRIVKTPPPAPTTASLAAVQDAMASELMLADVAHEALIQQYLRMNGQAFRDVAGQ